MGWKIGRGRYGAEANPSTPAIWTHTIHGESSALSWIYALQPDFTYDQLLKQGLREAITSLAATARTLK